MKNTDESQIKSNIPKTNWPEIIKKLFLGKIDNIIVTQNNWLSIVNWRVSLKNWNMQDKDILLSLANNSNIANNFIGFPFPYTENDAKNWINESLSNSSNNISFKITLNWDLVWWINCIIDHCSEKKIWIISYWVWEDFQWMWVWDKTIEAFIKYLFKDNWFDLLKAHVFKDNIASRKILEKNWFSDDWNLTTVTNDKWIEKKESILILEKDHYFKMSYIKDNLEIIKNVFENYNDFILDYVWLIPWIWEYSLKLKTWEVINLRKRNKEVSDIDIIAEIFINNDYNLENIVWEDMTIVDIWWQIGIFSLYASKYVKNWKIYSFEPLDENYSLLKKNSENSKSIIPLNMAVSSKTGESKIYISDDNVWGHSMIKSDNKKFQNIKTISLQDIFEQYEIDIIDLLKVDCEWQEYDIFFNLPDSYFDKINQIYMEVHFNDQISISHNKYDIVSLLVSKGYETNILNEFYYEWEWEFYIIHANRKK